MKKVKIIAGVTWAIFGLILIIILFPGLNGMAFSVSKLPFMKLNPRYTGGEIAWQMTTDNCTLDVRKPVFNGFLKEKKTGFVQIDWRGKLPDAIRDSIDYDRDGQVDFLIAIDRKTAKTEVSSLNTNVKDLLISTQTSYGWAVRIGLKKNEIIL
jgi:hypothetical protein